MLTNVAVILMLVPTFDYVVTRDINYTCCFIYFQN